MTAVESGADVSGRGRLSPARETVESMVEAGLLDELMARVDEGGLRLTGEGGFLPEMIKAVLERGLAAELSEHLGYERGDAGGPRLGELAQRLDAEDGGDRGR